jgi:hypothetical protein
VLLGKHIHLFRLQAGVCEHANLYIESKSELMLMVTFHTYLVGDVVPIVLAAEILEVFLE